MIANELDELIEIAQFLGDEPATRLMDYARELSVSDRRATRSYLPADDPWWSTHYPPNSVSFERRPVRLGR